MTIYTPDSRERVVDGINYEKRDSRHWKDYYKYLKTCLHSTSKIQIQAMVDRIKGSSKACISSDIEIKRILGILGSDFLDEYRTLGFSIAPSAMLGVQLFEYCVFERDNWWYPIPKPKHRIEYPFPHSHYYLRIA